MEKTTSQETRITAIDQLRGYAIFGMILVNSNELFGIEYRQFEHHRDWFSYADTIAPLFLFIVGIGMRLSWLRRSGTAGPGATRSAMAKRYLTLVLIAFAIYAGWLWDALMDIGLAGLLCLWLIDKKPGIRIAAAFILVGLYQAIVMWTFYGPWILRLDGAPPIDSHLLIRLIPLHGQLFDVRLNGGPLGPLSWSMMLLFGSLAYDLMAIGNHRKFALGCLGLGFGLCGMGYGLSLATGWPISAYYMTAPFPLWSSGLCFFTLLGFFILSDKLNVQIPTFTAMGMNPLFIYIIQCLVLDVIGGFDAPDMSFPLGVITFAAFYGCFAGLAWWMHSRRLYVKI
jgi:predicted acyltransferase